MAALRQIKVATGDRRQGAILHLSLSNSGIPTMRRLARSFPAPSSEGAGIQLSRPSVTWAGQVGWALFDWANSPFSVLILTFVFPAYFASTIVGDQLRGQALWGYTLGASGLVIALLSAPLGAIADVGGRRKPWILGFAVVSMLATALLWFAVPGRASLPLALICVAIAKLAGAFNVMFSNAMLPDIVSGDRLGRLSGWAWGLGYAGGLAALAIELIAFVQPSAPLLALDRTTAENIRIVGPLVAAWLALFAWPLFLLTPDRPIRHLAPARVLREGLDKLRQTLGDVRTRRNLLLFLIANMFYEDGLVTLFALSGIYVSGAFGMSLAEVVMFGLVLNVAAGLGAAASGWVDDWLGSRRTVVLALAGLIMASLAAVCVETRLWLWITGCLLGLFVGPVQSSSRSLMARLAPSDRVFRPLLALEQGDSLCRANYCGRCHGGHRQPENRPRDHLSFLATGFILLASGGRDGDG
jgi:MFS transporter, UMF1 family